ncbi:hypothetical protein A2Y85_02485 [candidate division WOR-3 bacterium RBG_13_43_14]|uniref:Uncharacterized protein n=1 Tax=candidate division WOR-3 bacterium RBG_13_43_14 TaxID=1802590 RepID=A0A1F4UBT0_UNCW3|nr:MAG: hypothetical protein A2Y85_02485 [candidate division WOR-3 bacterium RBG_13_43_14]
MEQENRTFHNFFTFQTIFIRMNAWNRLIVSGIGIILTIHLIISCQINTDNTILRYSGWVENNEFWFGCFNAERRMILTLDFLSVNGNEVDLLLMNGSGFEEFQQRIITSYVTPEWWVSPVPIETFKACTLMVETTKRYWFYVYSWFIDSMCYPVDIYLFDSTLFYQYLQGQNVLGLQFFFFTHYVYFDHQFDTSETVYLIVDNTFEHGSNPLGAALCHVAVGIYESQPFNYIAEGSRLNIDSACYMFELTESGDYYFVINNAGYVMDGATPAGKVEFDINLIGE